MDRIHCRSCEKRCYGEALRVQDFHFHPTCFVCKVCNAQLANQGFYMHDEYFYCSKDYLENFGTQCFTCGDYVEGDVISALGHTYHQHCFVCANCKQAFPPGEQVTQEGDECFCETCLKARDAETAARSCPKCEEFVETGQGLIALERIWHVWCFRCKECGIDLSSKYIVKDGETLCENDFNRLHGIRCEACGNFIAGKVVQAGDCYFHADCSRCGECSQPVVEDSDVFVLGSQLWHSTCFTGPNLSSQLTDNQQGGISQSQEGGDTIIKAPLPELVVHDSGLLGPSPASKPLDVNMPGTAMTSAAVSPPSSLNESPQRRPDSQGGDSAISCTTPSGGTSSEAEATTADQTAPAVSLSSAGPTSPAGLGPTSPAGLGPTSPAGLGPASPAGLGPASPDIPTTRTNSTEASNRPSNSDSLGLLTPLSSRPPSESSARYNSTPVNGEVDSYPSTPTPTPTPSGVIQRTPSTGSAGSAGRIRPKSIAGVPMRSGHSLSASAGAFNWKEMYSVDDKEEVSVLAKSCAGIKSLAQGVVSPSTAERFPRRDSRPGSQASVSSVDRTASPTSPLPTTVTNRSSSTSSAPSSLSAATGAAAAGAVVAAAAAALKPGPGDVAANTVSMTSEQSSVSTVPSLSLIEEAAQSPSPVTTHRAMTTPPLASADNGERKIFPLAELQLCEGDILLPKGVERSRLEEYLDDDDFRSALGHERDGFYKLQIWKQRELKRKAQLF